ncbi:hypothetical protein TSMEX_008701 [Taenia solium]|eukprot:TsM_000039500 transcript=TsM_000039500 gene=TsM_000039500
MYMNYVYLASCPAFWLCLPLVLVLALLPDILWRLSSDVWWDFQIALSGVKRIRERRKRLAWRNALNAIFQKIFHLTGEEKEKEKKEKEEEEEEEVPINA